MDLIEIDFSKAQPIKSRNNTLTAILCTWSDINGLTEGRYYNCIERNNKSVIIFPDDFGKKSEWDKIYFAKLTPAKIDYEIRQMICTIFKLTIEQLETMHNVRKYNLPIARQTHIAIRTNFFGDKYIDAGAIYEKDHSTTSHAIKTVSNLLETDKSYRNQTKYIFKYCIDMFGLKNLKKLYLPEDWKMKQLPDNYTQRIS